MGAPSTKDDVTLFYAYLISCLWLSYFHNKKGHVKMKFTGSHSTIVNLKAKMFIYTRQFDFSPWLHLK